MRPLRPPSTRPETAELLVRTGLARAYCALARRARSGVVDDATRAGVESEALEAIAGDDEATGESSLATIAAHYDAEQTLRVIFAYALKV